MGFTDSPHQPSGQQNISDGQLQERMYNDSYSRQATEQPTEGQAQPPITTMLQQALLNNSDQTASPYWQQVLTQLDPSLQLTVPQKPEQVPVTTTNDAAVIQTQPPTESTQTTASAQSQTDATQPPTDSSQKPGQQSQVGADPQTLMQDAQNDLNKKGMTAEVKGEFNTALKAADGLWTQQDVEVTAALLQALKTGQKPDGTEMSAADRMQAHQLVNEEFAAATLGIQYRMVYGSLLNQNKQFASAEQVFKDDITIADKLPLNSFAQELNQLGVDAQNPNLSQADQTQLVQYMQSIQGAGTSKDDGLIYLPITARKKAAIFYISGDLPGPNGEAPVGIVKPQQAMQMIDDAATKEKQLYGVDPNKDTTWDATLTNLAQSVLPMLPENIRKEKEQADKLWSAPLVDAGTAAGALFLASFVGAVVTKNPDMLEWAVKTDDSGAAVGLSLGGKSALGLGTIGTTTVGIHTLEPLSGSNESWGASAIHATAAVGAAWALLGVRSAGSSVLFKVANLNEGETATGAAIRRVAAEQGTITAGYNMNAGELATTLGKNAPKALKELDPSQPLITDGRLISTLPNTTESETQEIYKLARKKGANTASELSNKLGDKAPDSLNKLPADTPLFLDGKPDYALPDMTFSQTDKILQLASKAAPHDLTSDQLTEFMTGKGRKYIIPDAATNALNQDSAQEFVVQNGNLTDTTGQWTADALGYNSAQATTLAHDAAVGQKPGFVPRQFSKINPYNVVASVKGANPFSTLDLNSASAQQMGLRHFYSGYTGSLAAVGTYNTVTAFDGSTQPNETLGQRLLANNYTSAQDNVLINPLFFLTPAMADGKIAENFSSGKPFSSAIGSVRRLFSTSAPSVVNSSMLTGFDSQAAGLEKAMVVYNMNTLQSSASNLMASHELKGQLNAYNSPVTDETVPAPSSVNSKSSAS